MRTHNRTKREIPSVQSDALQQHQGEGITRCLFNEGICLAGSDVNLQSLSRAATAECRAGQNPECLISAAIVPELGLK